MRTTILAGASSGFVGGILGALLVAWLAHGGGAAIFPAASAASAQDLVVARRIQLVDASGRTRVDLALSPDGGPGMFFFDGKGRNRLVLGLYSPAESELPFVVLNDSQQGAAGIFRLFGAHETPVVVLKNQGRDRSIYGLNPNSLQPFLVNYGSDGKKSAAFGEF